MLAAMKRKIDALRQAYGPAASCYSHIHICTHVHAHAHREGERDRSAQAYMLTQRSCAHTAHIHAYIHTWTHAHAYTLTHGTETGAEVERAARPTLTLERYVASMAPADLRVHVAATDFAQAAAALIPSVSAADLDRYAALRASMEGGRPAPAQAQAQATATATAQAQAPSPAPSRTHAHALENPPPSVTTTRTGMVRTPAALPRYAAGTSRPTERMDATEVD
jgi:hypothetical protein